MAQLRRLAPEFQQRKTRILLICFAQERWARAFLEETGSPFPLLMDPERESYRAFGLKSSVARTYFSPATIWYYAKAILKGRKIHPKPRGNPHQMGGDFLIDCDGSLLLAHPSREPADRPSVEAILEKMGKESGEGRGETAEFAERRRGGR